MISRFRPSRSDSEPVTIVIPPATTAAMIPATSTVGRLCPAPSGLTP